jgi:hypothetical protein
MKVPAIFSPWIGMSQTAVPGVQHLLIHLLPGHVSSEHSSHREASVTSWFAGGHRVLGVKHLLSEFWYCEGLVLLVTTGGERSKAWHLEVQACVLDRVHC